jgi:predicted AAA+ superfamily ATPase
VPTVLREQYLDFLWKVKDDTKTVKIICGVRRCGKSTVMLQFIDRLRESGIQENNILYIDFENPKFDHIEDQKDLKQYFKEHITSGRTYVFLDEIQRVKDWEIAVNGLMSGNEADVYITGSNSKLLSSEFSTYLTGRYISIEMLPLSFKEYSEFHAEHNLNKYEMFDKYLKYGAFPGINPFADERIIASRLDDLYYSTIYKDAVLRGQIRDVSEFENVAKFLMMNIGNPVSFNKIAESLGNTNRKTVERYIKLLEDCYIFYRADRYDLKSTVLSHSPKFYSVDVGLRNSPLGYTDEDYGRLMENLVYLELIRKGDEVTVGKFGDSEIDFSVRTLKGREYYQVTFSMKGDRVKERELRSLRLLNDNFPKTVISTDILKADFADGIRHINIVDFLLGER